MSSVKIVVPLLVALLVLSQSVFIVDQREQAILFRLGEIKRTDFKPGLHFKLPFINNVKFFEKRLLNLDADPERFLTSEKKDVIVDSYVKWKIADVGAYYKATGGDSRRAGLLLYQKINDGLRAEFGKRTVQQVVAGERSEIMGIVTKNANREAKSLGVVVVDVRVKGISLPQEVSNSVYERMRAERERVARNFRSRGSEAAERIRANADRERTVILADAFRQAEVVRGEGDAISAKIYADAYDQDRDFYSFNRSLEAYRNSFGSKNDLLLIQPDADFFKYFKSPNAD